MMSRIAGVSVTAALCCVASAAPPTLIPLAPGSGFRAWSISGDGSVIAGDANGHAAMFRAGVLEFLSELPNSSGSVATGVSPEGDVIVGAIVDAEGRVQAARWSVHTNVPSLLSSPTPRSYTIAASGHGAVIAGYTIGDENSDFPVVWTSTGLFQELPLPQGFNHAEPTAISADGSVVIGVCWVDNGAPYRGFRWTASGGSQVLGPMSDLSGTGATAMNSDGSIVGYGRYLWTEASGWQLFTGLNIINGLSGNGSVVVGNWGSGAGYWTQETGTISLRDLFGSGTGNYDNLVAVSVDGKAAIGHGSVGGASSFLIRFSDRCSADFNGDGYVDFFDYLDFVDAFSIGC